MKKGYHFEFTINERGGSQIGLDLIRLISYDSAIFKCLRLFVSHEKRLDGLSCMPAVLAVRV